MITLGSSNGAIQVEAVDLAKVRRKFARLDRLKEVGLESEDIATLSAPHFAAERTGNANEDAAAILARTCPSSCVLFLPLPAPCAICPSARLERSTRQSRKRVRRGRHSTPCPAPTATFHISGTRLTPISSTLLLVSRAACFPPGGPFHFMFVVHCLMNHHLAFRLSGQCFNLPKKIMITLSHQNA